MDTHSVTKSGSSKSPLAKKVFLMKKQRLFFNSMSENTFWLHGVLNNSFIPNSTSFISIMC